MRHNAGDCHVQYEPETRELSVQITIDHMDVHIGSGGFEGNSQDIFWGKISPDGKTWETTWAHIYDYGPKLPFNEDNAERPLVFRKNDEILSK